MDNSSYFELCDFLEFSSMGKHLLPKHSFHEQLMYQSFVEQLLTSCKWLLDLLISECVASRPILIVFLYVIHYLLNFLKFLEVVKVDSYVVDFEVLSIFKPNHVSMETELYSFRKP